MAIEEFLKYVIVSKVVLELSVNILTLGYHRAKGSHTRKEFGVRITC